MPTCLSELKVHLPVLPPPQLSFGTGSTSQTKSGELRGPYAGKSAFNLGSDLCWGIQLVELVTLCTKDFEEDRPHTPFRCLGETMISNCRF